MRPLTERTVLRALGAVGTAALATMLMTAAAAPAAEETQNPTGATITSKVLDRSLRYGQTVRVRGRAAGQPGRSVALQFQPRGGEWRDVARATAARDGRFELRARLRQSGAVRVALVPDPATASAASAPPAAARNVAVAARLSVRRQSTAVMPGRRGTIRGTLRPGGQGRRVVLQARRGSRWVTVSRARTNPAGRFALRVSARRVGSRALRVRFPGDAANSAARRRAGRLSTFRRSYASWYGPGLYGGHLACGGRLSPGTLGVAHKTLPCGTKVTFRYRGRSVRVAVIDRGPFVGGREWDLTAATANRLGFRGHGAIWSTR